LDEEKMYCWYCKEEILNEDDAIKITILDIVRYVHKECQELSEKGIASHPNNYAINISQNPINTLRIIAWLTLAIGIIGAIVIWNTMGTTEVPFAIAISIATLFSSIVTWAVLSVICGMAENLIEIRNSLSNSNK
jgi:hypothetical protein